MVISRQARSVYNMGGKNNKSYGVTIPMEFAREMGFDNGEKHYVMIRLVRNGDDNEYDEYGFIRKRGTNKREKKKAPYLIVWKIED